MTERFAGGLPQLSVMKGIETNILAIYKVGFV
jgi:hypothetical protein